MSEMQNTSIQTIVTANDVASEPDKATLQIVDEVYTHARLKAMRDDININQCRQLAQRIKSDFLEDFSQKSVSSVSLWRKTYEAPELDNIVILCKELRKFFPDIYIGLNSDYRGNIIISIKPFEIKNPTDL